MRGGAEMEIIGNFVMFVVGVVFGFCTAALCSSGDDR